MLDEKKSRDPVSGRITAQDFDERGEPYVSGVERSVQAIRAMARITRAEAISWAGFLEENAGRGDEIGDFCADAVADRVFPFSPDWDLLLFHLRERDACPEAITA